MISWTALNPPLMLANALSAFYPKESEGERLLDAVNGSGSMDGTNRANIKADLQVSIVLKKDQHSGKLTQGRVKDILTKSLTHPHGIKVRLESGEIGRVKKIM